MKRRDFIKSTAAGVSGILGEGCSPPIHSTGVRRASIPDSFNGDSGPGFDVHPFVRNHPEAVFIHLTSVQSKGDSGAIHEVGYKLAQELILQTDLDTVSSGGYPNSTRIVVKPNWTSNAPHDKPPVYEKLGVNTDANFIEGWVQGMRTAGPQQYYIRECCCPQQWGPKGYRALADRNGIDLTDLTTLDYWELKKGDINFVKIPNGVMFKEIGYMAPANESPDSNNGGTFLVNIAKFKSHGMGITASVKNLQGLCGRRFHSFCHGIKNVRAYDKRYQKFLHKDWDKRLEENYTRHMKEGIPRWDKPGQSLKMETWVQRMLDSYSVTPTGLSMVEGIYGQDGNGFGRGSHDKLGPHGVTSRDYMSNMVIFGMDALRIDIITHWLGGHEPGNFGLFHVAIERGMLDVLNPMDIPVYRWKNGETTLTPLTDFERTPLNTRYIRKDYNGGTEPQYHMVDEEFDYSSVKLPLSELPEHPNIRIFNRVYPAARNQSVLIEYAVPCDDYVRIEILDSSMQSVVAVPVDNHRIRGYHLANWELTNHRPGTYFCRYRYKGYNRVQKIIVA